MSFIETSKIVVHKINTLLTVQQNQYKMFKKPIQKENKTDLDIEPKLVNKISPRSKVL